jgi:hypothetical protein
MVHTVHELSGPVDNYITQVDVIHNDDVGLIRDLPCIASTRRGHGSLLANTISWSSAVILK